MRFNWRAEAPLLMVVAAMFAIAIAGWPGAPARIPIHWNAQGVADGFASKTFGMLFDPALALGIYLVTLVIPRFDPGRANYSQFETAYFAIRLAILLLTLILYVVSQLQARDYPLDSSFVVPIVTGAFLAVVGNFMGKVRPNWFVGIRTPWTLSSKLAWDRTHRLGGWLFIGGGILMISSIAVSPGLKVAMNIGIPLAIVGGCFVYSYFVWRGDPDKQPPAGTTPASPVEPR